MKPFVLAALLFASLAAPTALATEEERCVEGVCVAAVSAGACDNVGFNAVRVMAARPEAYAEAQAATVCSPSTNGAGVDFEYATPVSAGVGQLAWIDSYGICHVGGYAFIQLPVVFQPVVATQPCPASPPQVPPLLP